VWRRSTTKTTTSSSPPRPNDAHPGEG
jgi:hypothetical protein